MNSTPRITRSADDRGRLRGWVQRRLQDLTATQSLDRDVELEETGEPVNYRAMELALRIGELLLASGEASEEVGVAMHSVATAYGLPRPESTVTFTAISLSCQPGSGEAPVTGERVVRRRALDYNRLAGIHRLVREASLGAVELEEAFERLYRIKHDPPIYPHWLLVVALGLIAASASVLSGGGVLVALVGFAATVLGDRTTVVLARHGIVLFYQYVAAAAIGTSVAMLLVALHASGHASALVVGAIMALLPGRALVASVQDGLTGSFVSSTARMVEAFYMVAALIAGAGVTVYVAVRTGVPMDVTSVPLTPASLDVSKVLAAVAMSVTFAVSLVVPFRALPVAAIGGGAIWVIDAVLTEHTVSPVMAAAIAAVVIGLFGHMVASWQQMPSLPYIVPVIGPLLPGTDMYRGLLQFSHGAVNNGLASLFQAVAIALALAAGLNLGGELVRVFGRGGLVTGVSPRRRPAARRTRSS